MLGWFGDASTSASRCNRARRSASCAKAWQDLDGDLTPQVGVGRVICLTHAAHADLGGDFIRTEANAGGKGQTIGMLAVRLRGRDYSRVTP